MGIVVFMCKVPQRDVIVFEMSLVLRTLEVVAIGGKQRA